MGAPKLSESHPEKYAEVRRRLAAGEQKQAISDAVGVSRNSVLKISREKAETPHATAHTAASSLTSPVLTPTPAGEPDQKFTENPDGSAVLSLHTESPIKTLDDAIRVAGVDLSTWFVERWECSQWTVPMKVRRGNGDEPITTQQYRVKVFLKRILPRALSAALDAIYARMAKSAPKFPRLPKPKINGEPYMAVFGLFDAHFGKLCWSAETGENYDLRIAEQVYANAVADLIAESKSRPIGQIVLPIGNDFFHMDNSRNTTYNGTPQDVDGRYWKVIEAGEMAVIHAVESLAEVAQVKVLWVPGNHDPTTSGHLARTVWAYFRNSSRVDVEMRPTTRKYIQWGVNLLGFTHGNEERHEDLPNLMANERPSEHAASECREWLLGHEHRSKKYVTKPTDTRTSTVIRVLQSLAGTDSWHYRKGFINTRHSAEVYWYGRDRGYAGHAVVTARNG